MSAETDSKTVRMVRTRSARASGQRVRRRRVRMEDLVLGMYVAEPDGIWTAIGTVTEERVATRRRSGPTRKTIR